MRRAALALVLLLLAGVAAAHAVTTGSPTVTTFTFTTDITVPTSTEAVTVPGPTTTVTTTVTAPTTTASTTTAPVSDVYGKPTPRYGISPSFHILQDSATDLDWELGRELDVGAKLIRLDYLVNNPWQTPADNIVAKAQAKGLEVELAVGGNAKSGDGGKAATTYGAECSAAASKYHGRVRYYEVFNEPNGGWNGPWDPVQYTSFLKACYQAVKAVDGRNVVLLGGIAPAAAPGIDMVPWVQKLYAAGAKPYFDVMNVHNYGDPQAPATYSTWCKTFGCNGLVSPAIIDVMAQYGDSGKPIFSTEGGESTAKVSEATQAMIVAHNLRDGRLASSLIYCLWCDGTVSSPGGFSLIRPDKTAKPAYGAFKQIANP